MDAGLCRHQFVKESSKEILVMAALARRYFLLLIKGIEGAYDLPLLSHGWYRNQMGFQIAACESSFGASTRLGD